jgi:hypothetical protein
MDKLADFFDPTTEAEFTGIYEGIAHPDKSTDARQAVAQVRERLRKFEQTLVRLGEDLSIHKGLASTYEYAAYALDTLDAYFRSVEAGVPAPLEPLGAQIFAMCVVDQIVELHFFAQELDHYHASR